MKTYRVPRTSRFVACLALTAGSVAPCAMAAVDIRPLPGGSDSLALETLVRAVAEHADVFRNYQQVSAARGQMLSETAIKEHIAKGRSATFATAEYDVINAQGKKVTYTYYAKSGPDLPDTIPDFKGDLSEYGGGRTNVKISQVNFDDFKPTIDFADGHGKRFTDAELKIARTIERDVSLGKIGADGRLKVWVSQAPCPSCTDALEKLGSSVLKNDVTVRYAAPNPGKDVNALSARFHARRVIELKSLGDTPVTGSRTPLPRPSAGCI